MNRKNLLRALFVLGTTPVIGGLYKLVFPNISGPALIVSGVVLMLAAWINGCIYKVPVHPRFRIIKFTEN